MMRSKRGELLSGPRMFVTWRAWLVAVLLVASGTMTWAAAGQRGSNGRNDYDWDDNDRDHHGVTYATLNIQGSRDNRCGDHPDSKEADYRREADIAWMRETFQIAKDRDSAAIKFISQADPGFSNRPVESEPIRDPKTLELVTPIPAGIVDGHRDFLLALREEVKTFRNPVAYVHGNTHYFRIDKPFYDSEPPDSVTTTARRLANFIRIETFGDNTFTAANTHPDPDEKNNVHWVKVFVDPDSREVFAFQPQIVPGNRPVGPAPWDPVFRKEGGEAPKRPGLAEFYRCSCHGAATSIEPRTDAAASHYGVRDYRVGP
jgi:hypothetical protein